MSELPDTFDAIVQGVELSEPDVDVVDVSTLPKSALVQRYNAVRRELVSLSEPIHPLTERGRQLHSERGALSIELRKRGML